MAATVPGCKSTSQRALLLAGLLPGTRELSGLLDSDDPRVLADALRACGAEIRWPAGTTRATVLGVGSSIVGRSIETPLWFGENGTGVRALGAALSLLGVEVRLDGHDRLQRRPMDALTAMVQRMGGGTSGERLPLTVDTRTSRHTDSSSSATLGLLTVEASTTTQVASGAVLGLAARAGAGRRSPYWAVHAVSPSSLGYLEVTMATLQMMGFSAARLALAAASAPTASASVDLAASALDPGTFKPGADCLMVPGPAPVPPVVVSRHEIPMDASTRTWPLAWTALTAPEQLRRCFDELELTSVGRAHADAAVDGVLQQIVDAREADELHIELGAMPDTFPALCAVAALGRRTPGWTHLRGAPALRAKESDRIAAMAHGLAAAGVEVTEFDDGLGIRSAFHLRSGPAGPEPRSVPCVPDHRIVMALAMVGGVLPGGIRIGHTETVAKSWPEFWSWFEQVADVSVG